MSIQLEYNELSTLFAMNLQLCGIMKISVSKFFHYPVSIINS